eukprot:5282498-Amphidinium_carterae.2
MLLPTAVLVIATHGHNKEKLQLREHSKKLVLGQHKANELPTMNCFRSTRDGMKHSPKHMFGIAQLD